MPALLNAAADLGASAVLRPSRTKVSNVAVSGGGDASAKARAGAAKDPGKPDKPDKDNGNNGKGNGEDPQPPGDPKKND